MSVGELSRVFSARVRDEEEGVFDEGNETRRACFGGRTKRRRPDVFARAREGLGAPRARRAVTRSRGGRGSARGRRTHAGVSVGRHAGSSCCVNLESAGDVRTGSGDGGERERGERSRAHETLVDAGVSSRAHRRRGTHFSAPNSASGRTTRARAHESDEASEVRKAFFVFVRASSSVARVLSEKYTTDTLRPKSDPALLCHHASTT